MEITFDTGPRKGWVAPMASATIKYAKVDDHWEAGLSYEFWCGDHRGCSGPIHGAWPTAEAATEYHLARLLRMLQELAGKEIGRCCFSERQRETAQHLLTQVEQYLGIDTVEGQTDMFAII